MPRKLPGKLYGVALVSLFLSTMSTETEARRISYHGPNVGGTAYSNHGQYGSRSGARIFGANQGGGLRRGNYAGPNGGTLNSNGNFGYRRGVGAFHNSRWNGTAPGGASGSGYTHNQYNSHTGQGERSSSEQVQTASGKDYGYTGNTTYAKGEGANAVVQTDNHGSYDVDWQKGQKPVVAPITQ